MKRDSAIMSRYYGYPENDVHCYKRHINDEQQDTNGATKVLEVKKAVARREREMVRQLDDKKRIYEKQVLQARLREEIAEKKRQIEELEIIRQRSQQQQLRSFELARIREQQVQKQYIQAQKRKIQQQKLAKMRGDEAKKRLENERIQLEQKQREAQRRRDVATVAQQKHRKKAIKYRQEQQLIQQIIPTKVGFDQFNKNHGTAKYNRNIDYSKTYMHNPVIIKAKQTLEIDAHQKARLMQEQIDERRQRRQQEQESKRLRADKRSEEAFRKLSAQKMAQQLRDQAANQLLRYNHQKIQMGKKDQSIGIRPLTRTQKEINKQKRDQDEFQQIFFTGKSPAWVTQPCQKFEIQAKRQLSKPKLKETQKITMTNKVTSSRIPQASTVKYSFEDDALSLSGQFEYQNNQQIMVNHQIDNQQQYSSQSKYNVSPQTKIISQQIKSNYSPKSNQINQIPKSPPKQNMKMTRDTMKETQNKGERRIVYNYQMDGGNNIQTKISPAKRSQQSLGLNNLCENRQHSDLSYSDDEEDSLEQ